MSRPFRIMVACVTVEVDMVVTPALWYLPREIRLFRYIRDPGSGKAKLYTDHYAEVVRELRDTIPFCKVVECTDEPVYDFRRMARSLELMYSSVEKEHPDFEIYANLSSGPAEFAAALGLFSYLHPGVVLFKAPTKEFAVGEEELDRYFYRDGTAVGLSRSVYPPKTIPGVRLEPPDETQVRALRIYNNLIQEGTEPHCRTMISALKENGLWRYEPYGKECSTGMERREMMNYLRHYRSYWKDKQWIRNERRRCPRLTPEGMAAIEMFYVE